jgi:hypothetical protein
MARVAYVRISLSRWANVAGLVSQEMAREMAKKYALCSLNYFKLLMLTVDRLLTGEGNGAAYDKCHTLATRILD